MDQELKEKLVNIFKEHQLASLATIKDGRPWVRYVMTTGHELDLYVNTHRESRKVQQIYKDANVHVVLGFSGDMQNPEYVQVEGVAEILDDSETRQNMWMDYLSNYFKSVDDPNFVVIKIKPKLIEYYEAGSMSPKTVTLS
jgi:general stress protein 26